MAAAGRNNGAAGGDFVAHKLRLNGFADGDEFHFRGDGSGAGELELRGVVALSDPVGTDRGQRAVEGGAGGVVDADRRVIVFLRAVFVERVSQLDFAEGNADILTGAGHINST